MSQSNVGLSQSVGNKVHLLQESPQIFEKTHARMTIGKLLRPKFDYGPINAQRAAECHTASVGHQKATKD